MSRMDDLVPLLAPSGGGEDVGFSSGVVESYNGSTGANTIRVAGTVLVDVPILNTGDAIRLQAGHIVALLRFKTSYFVLGRVTVPGSDQFASSAVAFDAKGDANWGHTVNTNELVRVSVALPWPSWADEAVIFMTGTANAVNQSSFTESFGVKPTYAGLDGTVCYSDTIPPGHNGHATQSLTQILRREDYPGLTQIVCGLKTYSPLHGWGSHGNNLSTVHAVGIFRSSK